MTMAARREQPAADDPAASAASGAISVDGGKRSVIEDVGSTYGTWLDGHPWTAGGLRDELAIRARQSGAGGRAMARRGRAGRTVVVRRATRSRCRSGRHADSRRPRPPSVRTTGPIRLRAEAPRGVRGRQAVGAEGSGIESLPADVGRQRGLFEPARRGAHPGRPCRDRSGASRERAGARWPAPCSPSSPSAAAGRVEGAEAGAEPAGLGQRLLAPREKTWAGVAGGCFDWLYRRGAWRLGFTDRHSP